MAPPSPILLSESIDPGDGLVCLAVFSAITNAGRATGGTYASPKDYTAAKPAVSTPRQPRESDSYVCAFRLPARATEVSLQCHACEVAWSAVECRVLMCRLTRARPCSWCRGTTGAVMLWSLVLHLVPPTQVRSRHTFPLRPALFLDIANSSRILRFQPPLADTQNSPSRIAAS